MIEEASESGRKSLPRNYRKLDIRDLLPERMRSRLWLRLHQERLKEGHHLFHQGEAGDTIYLVREGELAVFISAGNEKPTLLNLIGPDEIIGESCLLEPGSRYADVVANKNTIIVKLPRRKIIDAMEETPELKAEIQRIADSRQMVALLSANALLKIIPMDMRSDLAHETFTKQYPANSVIYAAGEKSNCIDLVAAGKACYIWNDGDTKKVLETLYTGSLSGYTSIIQNAGHPAELIAVKETTMAHIPYAAFTKIVDVYPPLRQALLIHADRSQKKIMRKLDELQTQEF